VPRFALPLSTTTFYPPEFSNLEFSTPVILCHFRVFSSGVFGIPALHARALNVADAGANILVRHAREPAGPQGGHGRHL